MIYTYIPYCEKGKGIPEGKDVGLAMNQFMELLGKDDWAFLGEHDVMPTTADWFRRMERATRAIPDAGFFVPKRYFCDPSNNYLAPAGMGTGPPSTDITVHYEIGKAVAERYDGQLTDITDPPGANISALWLISRKSWERAGGFDSGYKGIDRRFHGKVKRAGMRCYLLEDVYMAHFKEMFP